MHDNVRVLCNLERAIGKNAYTLVFFRSATKAKRHLGYLFTVMVLRGGADHDGGGVDKKFTRVSVSELMMDSQ